MKWENLTKEIQDKMLEYQVQQGNPRNPVVFINNIKASRPQEGFTWHRTPEGQHFWDNIISGNISRFYKKYPKTTYPKVMRVSDYPITSNNKGFKRVVFMEKKGHYLAWDGAETIKDAEKVLTVSSWKFAKDIESEDEIVELTLDDISKGKGVGVDPSKIRIKK